MDQTFFTENRQALYRTLPLGGFVFFQVLVFVNGEACTFGNALKKRIEVVTTVPAFQTVARSVARA